MGYRAGLNHSTCTCSDTLRPEQSTTSSSIGGRGGAPARFFVTVEDERLEVSAQTTCKVPWEAVRLLAGLCACSRGLTAERSRQGLQVQSRFESYGCSEHGVPVIVSAPASMCDSHIALCQKVAGAATASASAGKDEDLSGSYQSLRPGLCLQLPSDRMF